MFRHDMPTLSLPDISTEELIALRSRFVLYVKMPYEFFKYIKRSEKNDETGEKLTSELHRIYDEAVFANDGVWDDNGKSEGYMKRLEDILRN